MSLTREQIKDLRIQLFEQVRHLPEDKRRQAEEQIESMSDEAIELMLKEQQETPVKGSPAIFRSIVSEELPSYKIDENKDCLAVLDINPISRGHIIIIPKKAVSSTQSLPNSVFTLAKKLSKKINKKLKSSSTELQTEEKFNEKILHIIPIYDSPLDLSSPRKKVSKEELENTANLVRFIRKQKITKIKMRKPEPSQFLKLKRRIA